MPLKSANKDLNTPCCCNTISCIMKDKNIQDIVSLIKW